MKAINLTEGSGIQLYLVTRMIFMQLVPVYSKPMSLQLVKTIERWQVLKFACLEAIPWRKEWISTVALSEIVIPSEKSFMRLTFGRVNSTGG